ncbi:MAG: hypothetical protein JRJ82_18050 [Deltaproteobacteria bacterium]|nr:hypothetical protein [Deltaproteobacteria bacterium]
MNGLCRLLSPRILGFRNSLKRPGTQMRKRALIMAALGIAFWGMMFLLATRVLIYFQSTEVIGDILAHHLLAMVLLTFFSLLIFSNIITALSNLYLSADLELCHSSPTHLDEVFLSRCVYTGIDSSWMVIVFGLPVMMAYAYVYRPGMEYYLYLFLMGLPLAMIATGIGVLFTMMMVSIFPAQRTRDILMILMVFLIAGLYILFRFLRPERLADPEAFFSVMHYISALKAPDSPYLPTHWATENLWSSLTNSAGKEQLFRTGLMWSTAMALVFINVWVSEAVYFSGFSKSQEAKRRRGGRKLLDRFIRILRRPLGTELGSILDKDVRIFFRDNTQWSQLLLLVALVVVYLYNFSVLPLERSPVRLEFLQNEIAFLNMGLAGFVLAAVSVRFIFPAVSSEGGAFWIIRSSPISMKRFLWSKFALYIVPMVLLGETLIVVTNYLLDVTPFMMILSTITMSMAVFGIVGMAIGFGALYPNFKYENISQVATGFGGLMYMIFAALLMAVIIILEAGPVYIIFMAGVRGKAVSLAHWAYIVPSFLAVLAVCFFAFYKPLKMGLKFLTRFEA